MAIHKRMTFCVLQVSTLIRSCQKYHKGNVKSCREYKEQLLIKLKAFARADIVSLRIDNVENLKF